MAVSESSLSIDSEFQLSEESSDVLDESSSSSHSADTSEGEVLRGDVDLSRSIWTPEIFQT